MQGLPDREAGGGQVDISVGGAGRGRQLGACHGHALHGRAQGQVCLPLRLFGNFILFSKMMQNTALQITGRASLADMLLI